MNAGMISDRLIDEERYSQRNKFLSSCGPCAYAVALMIGLGVTAYALTSIDLARATAPLPPAHGLSPSVHTDQESSALGSNQYLKLKADMKKHLEREPGGMSNYANIAKTRGEMATGASIDDIAPLLIEPFRTVATPASLVQGRRLSLWEHAQSSPDQPAIEELTINCPRATPHVQFRLRHTAMQFDRLQFGAMLDIGGNQFKQYCAQRRVKYTHVDIKGPLKTGQGGYFGGGDTYDGRNLPYPAASYDIVLLSFVLHHASHNTFKLLEQVQKITRRYLVVGEDLMELGYPAAWHLRNFKHQPGGLFRSDEEWRYIFSFFGFRLFKVVRITEDIDLDKDRTYRILYFLEKRMARRGAGE